MMSWGDEIQTTTEQFQKIRLLSDGELYRMACDFVDKHGTIESKKQAVSLVAHTQNWGDIESFVKHQDNRNWTGRFSDYNTFFKALKNELTELHRRTEEEWFPPPSERDTKTKRNAWADHYAILTAREFLQHLEAEIIYVNP